MTDHIAVREKEVYVEMARCIPDEHTPQDKSTDGI
jgi:hypothetical protein